jgi:dolichol-phosphate mannosyltransferase
MREALVIIPTYNEKDNLESIVHRVLATGTADVLIVDDNSPDGTGVLADQMAQANPAINVIHRSEKAGLGMAYLAGFKWGRARGYDALIEMDADGSHHPETLPEMLEYLKTHDVVLGSRWVPGGEVVNWPLRRKLLSRGGNLYAQLALGISVRDATGGFRAYRTAALDRIGLDNIQSHGYCFQLDLVWRALQNELRVVEIPITFTERTLGESKMNGSIVRESLIRVTLWGLHRRLTFTKELLVHHNRLPSVRQTSSIAN